MSTIAKKIKMNGKKNVRNLPNKIPPFLTDTECNKFTELLELSNWKTDIVHF